MTNPGSYHAENVWLGGAAGEVLYWIITIGALGRPVHHLERLFMASALLLMGMSRGRLDAQGLCNQNKNGIPCSLLCWSA